MFVLSKETGVETVIERFMRDGRRFGSTRYHCAVVQNQQVLLTSPAARMLRNEIVVNRPEEVFYFRYIPIIAAGVYEVRNMQVLKGGWEWSDGIKRLWLWDLRIRLCPNR
ncbi:UNVERIFIED_CONTAM: hypothetical protein Sradi_0721800 [Sesamum radiatum]|uniref:Uncharacterized protein n=1 Tax=Sesamum radiatum TaxID=300843 RepID=A0AAW2VNS2_SESRA